MRWNWKKKSGACLNSGYDLEANLFYLPCLPPVSWWVAVKNSTKVVLEACEHYSKGSWRNRYMLAGPNGAQLLSIPLLKGKHQQKPIREVRISYEVAWQRQHWRTICTAYGNAPYFEHYADEIRVFYEKEFEFLWDYNGAWLSFLSKKWRWEVPWQTTGAYTSADQWLSGNDYRHHWPSPVFKPYPQVFSDRYGFQSDLSSLDLLFCCGNKSSDFL